MNRHMLAFGLGMLALTAAVQASAPPATSPQSPAYWLRRAMREEMGREGDFVTNEVGFFLIEVGDLDLAREWAGVRLKRFSTKRAPQAEQMMPLGRQFCCGRRTGCGALPVRAS